MKEIVFLNGRFIPAAQARVSVAAPGFLYGWGLFESMRAVAGKIVYLDTHLERLKASSGALKISLAYSTQELKKIITRTIAENKLCDAYVRLTLARSLKDSDLLVTAKKYLPYPARKYQAGFSTCVSSLRQNENSFLAQHKTTNYLFYRLAFVQAKKSNYDEALILNNRGHLTEGSRSNIFLVKEKEVFTPALECGCLNGITRRVIFALCAQAKIKIWEGKLCLADLLAADEAFLTNSLIGVMPLSSVEGKVIGKERCGRLSNLLQKKYRYLLD
jgi:branched-subunit amino acid aminotransferase/4-amino-4-deoxychorismate lyase